MDRTPEEKKTGLFLQQKKLLDIFLAHRTITRQQYDKSLHDLTEKMGMEDVGQPEPKRGKLE